MRQGEAHKKTTPKTGREKRAERKKWKGVRKHRSGDIEKKPRALLEHQNEGRELRKNFQCERRVQKKGF